MRSPGDPHMHGEAPISPTGCGQRIKEQGLSSRRVVWSSCGTRLTLWVRTGLPGEGVSSASQGWWPGRPSGKEDSVTALGFEHLPSTFSPQPGHHHTLLLLVPHSYVLPQPRRTPGQGRGSLALCPQIWSGLWFIAGAGQARGERVNKQPRGWEAARLRGQGLGPSGPTVSGTDQTLI